MRVVVNFAVLVATAACSGSSPPPRAASVAITADGNDVVPPCGADAPPATGTTDEQIQAAYGRLRQALIHEDWCTVATLADAETLRVYEVLRQWALHMPREQLALQSFTHQRLVLAMRRRLGVKLHAMSSADVIRAGVVAGVLFYYLQSTELERVRGDGEIAYVTPTRARRFQTPAEYRMTRERGRWHFDMSWVMKIADEDMARFQREYPDLVAARVASVLEREAGFWTPTCVTAAEPCRP